jgi:hypothetical protein
MSIAQPAGDTSWRHVCSACSYVDYFNPKLVVGTIVEHQGKILLCKRWALCCRGWEYPDKHQGGTCLCELLGYQAAALHVWRDA